MSERPGRGGVSLFEVLLAACIGVALMMPLLGLFSSTTEWAGQDLRRVEACNRALEVMEQLANIHKRLGKLFVVPNQGTGGTGDELDLDAYAGQFTSEQGVPLLRDTSRCAWNTRLFLMPTSQLYHRYLRIRIVDSAPPKRNFWADALFEARVRINYPALAAGPDVRRDFILTSNFFQKCRPDGKFRELE